MESHKYLNEILKCASKSKKDKGALDKVGDVLSVALPAGIGAAAGREIGMRKSKMYEPIAKSRILVHKLISNPRTRKQGLEAGLALEKAIKKGKFFKPWRRAKLIGTLAGALGLGALGYAGKKAGEKLEDTMD